MGTLRIPFRSCKGCNGGYWNAVENTDDWFRDRALPITRSQRYSDLPPVFQPVFTCEANEQPNCVYNLAHGPESHRCRKLKP